MSRRDWCTLLISVEMCEAALMGIALFNHLDIDQTVGLALIGLPLGVLYAGAVKILRERE